MTHVVTENCQKCRFTECVSICPVRCFHSDGDMVYINPDVCVDCGACIPACPVQAIYQVFTLPDELTEWVEINAMQSNALPILKSKQDPLATSEARKTELGF